MSQFKSISFFVAISVLAGGLNYLFQVVAARSLTVRDFSEFNEWFAHASLFAFSGGLLQNGANFYPIEKRTLFWQCLGFAAICGYILWFTAFGDLDIQIFTFAFITLTAINGWLTGQSQVRLMYATMASAGALLAFTKVFLTILPFSEMNSGVYIKIATVSVIPSILLLGTLQIFRKIPISNKKLHTSKQALIAAGVLTAASAIIPQLDILVLSKTLEQSIFDQFIQASIFYKVVFFFFLIFAQWLLPQQARQKKTFIGDHLYNYLPIILSFMAAIILTAVSQPISVYVMNWTPPPLGYVFFSCINMSLLTWMFLLIQETCAKKIPLTALYTIIALVALGLLQYWGAWEIYIYFSINGVVMSGLVFFLLSSLKRQKNQ